MVQETGAAVMSKARTGRDRPQEYQGLNAHRQTNMGTRSMLTLLYLLLALGLFGADWPQLRDPNGSGLCSSGGKLPTEFGPRKNVLWKTDLPVGKSSPVLAGDRIFLTASEGDDLITMCLSRTIGKVGLVQIGDT